VKGVHDGGGAPGEEEQEGKGTASHFRAGPTVQSVYSRGGNGNALTPRGAMVGRLVGRGRRSRDSRQAKTCPSAIAGMGGVCSVAWTPNLALMPEVD
jgi:hypothetical protein